jgi:hypothetical protein
MNERRSGRIREAEAVLQRLRLIPPQHATRETVAAYQHALSLLADCEGSPLWFETLDSLASHLVESPHGVRAENIDSAKSAYRAMLAQASQEGPPDVWDSRCRRACAGSHVTPCRHRGRLS